MEFGALARKCQNGTRFTWHGKHGHENECFIDNISTLFRSYIPCADFISIVMIRAQRCTRQYMAIVIQRFKKKLYMATVLSYFRPVSDRMFAVWVVAALCLGDIYFSVIWNWKYRFKFKPVFFARPALWRSSLPKLDDVIRTIHYATAFGNLT